MIKKSLKKLKQNYWFIVHLISGTAFLIFLFFTTKVKSLPLDVTNLAIYTAMSILIEYQCALIKNIMPRITQTFKKLSPLFQEYQYETFSMNFQRQLHNFWRLCFTIIIVVIPFVILKLIQVRNWNLFKEEPPFFHSLDPTHWALLLDIFSAIFEYSILILLAVIIWIMIELTLIIKKLSEEYEVNVDIYNVDEIGGLKPLRSFILSILSNYFIIITLSIIWYIPQVETVISLIYLKVLITPQIIILILMLLIGIALFITTEMTIRNFIDRGVDSELEKINNKYKKIYNKIDGILSNKINDYSEKELGELRIALDILEKKEARIKAIKNKRFDIKTIVTFISTILLPILTLIHQIRTLQS